MSELLQRLLDAGIAHRANDNVSDHLHGGDLTRIEVDAAAAIRQLLDALLIDQTDPNTQATATRVARMMVREVFAGRYTAMPELTDFPNTGRLDELYTVGPVAIRSACSHHLCPVEGQVWFGVIPGERVIGLSKFSRIARWVMARPQIQEEAVMQLANLLEEKLKPKGLAVALRARHSCMTWRGVQEQATTMTTNVVRGILKEDARARAEFFQTIAGQGFVCQS